MSNQRVLVPALGTKNQTRRVLDLIGEMLDRFDKYLGPIDLRR